MATYFPVPADYSALSFGQTVNGEIVFTPNVNGVALDTSATPPLGWVPSPTVGAIVNGNLQTSITNPAPVYLPAQTSDLNLSGTLQYTTLFQVMVGGESVPVPGFLFDAQVPRATSDAAITINTTTLTSATASFTSADVGGVVTVAGAVASGTSGVITTIVSVTNSTTVVLSSQATATVSGAALTVCQPIDLITVAPATSALAFGAVSPTTFGTELVTAANQAAVIALLGLGGGQDTYLGTSANQTAMLALTGVEGSWTIRTDTTPNTVWYLTGSPASTLGSWTELPTEAVTLTNSVALSNKDLTSGTNTFPTFNQNTTGSAAKLTTARNINGTAFDGTANITVAVADSINVLNHGVVADGVTDNTTALAAIVTTVVAAGGGTILFPPATSQYMGSLVINANVPVKVIGPGAVLQGPSGGTVLTIDTGQTGGSGQTVIVDKGFTVKGNADQTTDGVLVKDTSRARVLCDIVRTNNARRIQNYSSGQNCEGTVFDGLVNDCVTGVKMEIVSGGPSFDETIVRGGINNVTTGISLPTGSTHVRSCFDATVWVGRTGSTNGVVMYTDADMTHAWGRLGAELYVAATSATGVMVGPNATGFNLCDLELHIQGSVNPTVDVSTSGGSGKVALWREGLGHVGQSNSTPGTNMVGPNARSMTDTFPRSGFSLGSASNAPMPPGRDGLFFGPGNAQADTTLFRAGAHILEQGYSDVFLTGQAATGSRPSASTSTQGAQFFDTTLNLPIWSNGSTWVVPVDTASAQTLTNKTLTSPKLSQIKDVNGNLIIDFGAQTSSVNWIEVDNGATGVSPTIYGWGTDTNVDLVLSTKGTGQVKANNVPVVTTTGTQTLTNKTLTSPALTTPTLTNQTDSVVAIGSTGTAKTISLTSGTFQTATLTGNCTFTMPSVVAGKTFKVLLNTGAGSFTASFTGVKWPSATAPTITVTAARLDILTFTSDGTDWYGTFVQNYTP